MTRDEIIAMAKEAGSVSAAFWPDDFPGLMGVFERFAALATAAEREACAKVCDDKAQDISLSNRRRCDADALATAIRQRGAA